MRVTSSATLKGAAMGLAGALLGVLLATSAGAWGETDTATTAATAATTTSAGTLTTTQATDCGSCHGADVVEGHHQSDDFLNGNCTACHTGITTGNDCSTCHTFSLQNNNHHLADAGESVDCGLCHTGGNDPQNCLGCHAGQVGNRHHEVAAAFGAACSACHPGTTAPANCQECHSATREQHHTAAASQELACTSCHSSMLVPQNCQSCHQAGSKRASHHALATQGGLDCHACHAPIPAGSLGTGCTQCHGPGNNREFHHETVMATEGLSCGACHSGAPAAGNCATCHQGETSAIHHASADYQAGNCGACHSSSGLAEDSCRSCHHFLPTDPLYAGNKHHQANPYGLGCFDCHTSSGGVMLPPAADDCVFCHERVLGATDLQPRHHATAPAGSGNCAACHQGGGSGGLDCAGCHLDNTTPTAVAIHHDAAAGSPYASGNCSLCHTGISGGQPCSACHTSPAGSTVLSRHHDQYAVANGMGCSACHTGADAVFQSCDTSGCHVRAGSSLTTRHHMTIPAQLEQCATCHTGVDTTPLSCAGCHQTADGVPIAERHHTSATAQTGNCAACHSAVSTQDIPCAACHSGGNHHLQPQAIAGDCGYCHGNVELVGTSCAGCHTAPIPQIHHGDPLTAVAGNCAVCHQSASDPGVCANCHASSPHHTTAWSQDGDCAHCHAIPAWAADRPAQAACRECHGSSMHDKGGPIQNYGACAACHGTTPYHPAPTSIPGYTGYGAGKKKFNMFWSKYAREEGPGERIYPNGEDMNDEGGDKIKAQQLSFSTKQISSNGKTYTVPYFTGMPGSNLLLGKPATASRAESGYGATLAIDGNVISRWWARSTSSQWLQVDLGAAKTISKVALRWHSYYARSYQIQVSTDNRSWSTVFSNNYGSGGMETRTFTPRSARYIRIYCQSAASSNGYSLYELEAYAQ